MEVLPASELTSSSREIESSSDGPRFGLIFGRPISVAVMGSRDNGGNFGRDVIGDGCDVIGDRCDVIGDGCDVIADHLGRVPSRLGPIG